MKNDLNLKTINFKNINKKLLFINGILLLAFFSAQVIATSHYGTKTQEIDATRLEKDAVRQENKFLEAEIDKARTFTATKDIIEKYNLIEKGTTFVDDANFDGLAVQVK